MLDVNGRLFQNCRLVLKCTLATCCITMLSNKMSRLRVPGLLWPFVICSFILVIPTLFFLNANRPPRPTNDATTAIGLSKLFEVGSELEGGVIMPKLANATAKSVCYALRVYRAD